MDSLHISSGPGGIWYPDRRGNLINLPTTHHVGLDDGEQTFLSFIEDQLDEEDKGVFQKAIHLSRESHEGQERKGHYYDISRKCHIDKKKKYHTHTEGVLEFTYFFREQGSFVGSLPIIVVAVLTLFHDIFEDGDAKSIRDAVVFIHKHFSEGKYGNIRDDMFKILLLLTKPENNQADIYDALGEVGFVNDTSIELRRADTLFVIDVSRTLVGEVLARSESLEESWRHPYTNPHHTPFCAPHDPELDGIVNSSLSIKDSTPYSLNNEYGLNWLKIRHLYRFVENAFFVWWNENNKDFSTFPDAIKFHTRIQSDLAAMLQIMSMSEEASIQNESERVKKVTIFIKLCDQLYNTWDNYYLYNPENSPEKQNEYIFKTKILAMRALLYEKLLLSEIGFNSPLHRVFSHVCGKLFSILQQLEKSTLSVRPSE